MQEVFNKKKTLNLRGQLFNIDRPLVMGILNVTPDSFFDGGLYPDEASIKKRVQSMVDEGADIIDVGAYSSRPGAAEVSSAAEIERLATALDIIKKMGVNVPLSVDTFRSEVADFALRYDEVVMINDISGGQIDEKIFDVAAKHQAVYVLMHMRGTPQTMMKEGYYKDLVPDILLYFSERIAKLKACGVKDIIIDPGFGFAKDMEQNYNLLSHLEVFAALEVPLLVGVSRKSMIYKLLGVTPDEALNGTTVLHTLALSKGADILRVHDVKAARECVTIYEKMG